MNDSNVKGRRVFGWVGTISGPTKAILAGVFGFVLGIAGSQAADIGARADACNDALTDYVNGLAFVRINSPIMNDPRTTPEQWDAATTEILDKWSSAHNKALNTCPMYESSWLEMEDVRTWAAKAEYIGTHCFVERKCDVKEATALVEDARASTLILLDQGNGVDTWGILHRAWYTFQHLW